MSSVPDLMRSLSRPPSAAPSRSASVSRSNSNTSSPTKKRPRGEEYLNELSEDITMIHDPRPATPPPTQSAGEAAKRSGSVSSRSGRGGSGDRSSTPDAPVPPGLIGGGGGEEGRESSLDRMIMPPPVSPSKGGGGGSGVNEGKNGGGVEDNGSTEDRHERESSVSTDDLLVQLPDYNWAGFMARFEEALKEIGAEKEWLSKEYDMWNWMYEIWSSSRDHDDARRLSREMATIIQWTRLKEADLERAREAHTQSMLAISSVLGIVPKNATPPLLSGKNKKR
ncbi:hypothetical protein Q9L58_001229 [Maublancomyces gigas]|uniref:Uncharacterized protein n=1 Tax=Discina gigas TaxID=1032678 RepID=A0ABR3GUP6_9PEZI